MRRKHGRINNFFYNIGKFVTNHWKKLVILLIAILLLIALRWAFLSIGKLFGASKNNTDGQLGVVTFDGQRIGVFETKNEALQDSHITTNVSAGIHDVKVSGNGNIEVAVKMGGFDEHLSTELGGKKFQIDLTSVGNNQTVIIEVAIGGDETLSSKLFDSDRKAYYFALQVKNENVGSFTESKRLTLPGGNVYFGNGSTYQTYQVFDNERDAQTYINYNRIWLPTNFGNIVNVIAYPGENTSRIFVKIAMIDGNDIAASGWIRLDGDSNWSGSIDFSNYAGHQVTLSIKFEDAMGVASTYKYVSIFIPELNVNG